MKKKIVMEIICALTVAAFITGCDNKEAVNTPTVDVTVSEGSDSNSGEASESGSTGENKGTSIQDEIEEVESKEAENADKAQTCETQMDMNINSAELYEIWDNELNSLWSRLSNELDSDKKEVLLAEQREWIKNKDEYMKAAGAGNEGGSIQPLLISEAGAYITKCRVYEFAKLLAEVHGEDFVIPEDVVADINALNRSLDDTLAEYEGKHIVDEAAGTVICIEKLADSDFVAVDFSPETKWVVWYTHGEVLTDQDIVSYNTYRILFKKGENYYSIEENMAGGIDLCCGPTEDTLEYVMGSDD